MMGTTEIAEKKGVTERTVREAIHRGELTATKYKRKWLISNRDAQRWTPNAPGRPRTRDEDRLTERTCVWWNSRTYAVLGKLRRQDEKDIPAVVRRLVRSHPDFA